MVNREPEHSESWPSELDVEFKELRSPRARSKVSDFSEEDRELVLSATRQQILERVADHLHEVDRFPTARAFDSTFAEHARVTLTVLRWAFGTYAEFTAELSTLIGHTMDPGKRVPRTTIQIGSGTDGLALSKIVYKYFDLTDQFLRIRVVDPEAIQLIEGLGKVSRLGKSDYRLSLIHI